MKKKTEIRGIEAIAGYEDEKRELLKIIRLFKGYDKYSKEGIVLPRGLILQGPPGCGKTLMASVLANECDVPFYKFDSLDDDPAKTTASLKKMFDQAESTGEPSIIYIDEIDSIVSSYSYETDASKKTTKFLMTKLDGLSKNSQNVMVIASTNHYTDIPEELLRSGRFDKKIKIDFPDYDARKKILEMYMNGHKLFSSLNVGLLASKLQGMSGADIKTLVNNALIEYIDEGRELVVNDFERIINEMQFETIGKAWHKKTNAIKVLAHEMGHAITCYAIRDMCSSVSAIQYGRTNGFTRFTKSRYSPVQVEEESLGVLTKQELLDEICISLGGMAAEKLFFGEYTTGVGMDFDESVAIMKTAVKYGFMGMRFVGIDFDDPTSDKLHENFERIKGKTIAKQCKRAYNLLKKNECLCKFLILKALLNSNAFTESDMKTYLGEYESDRKSIDAKMKSVRIDKMGDEDDE